jgi:hypothetical protein
VAVQTLRELTILRKFSQEESNVFTTKLVDIIIPGSQIGKSKKLKMSSNSLNETHEINELMKNMTVSKTTNTTLSKEEV